MSYQVRPEEHEIREARQVVEKTLESVKYVLNKETDFKVDLGYAHEDEADGFGVFGRASSSENVELFFNSSVDGWKDNLKDLVADAYGQAWFYEKSEINFKWQQLLASTTGLLVIEEVSEERKVETDKLKEEWAEKKTDLSEEYFGEEIPISWQLKISIGRRLLEEHDLEDLPDLKRTDVLEAGDSLFN